MNKSMNKEINVTYGIKKQTKESIKKSKNKGFNLEDKRFYLKNSKRGLGIESKVVKNLNIEMEEEITMDTADSLNKKINIVRKDAIPPLEKLSSKSKELIHDNIEQRSNGDEDNQLQYSNEKPYEPEDELKSFGIVPEEMSFVESLTNNSNNESGKKINKIDIQNEEINHE